ncbi:hypothetical protein L4X63_04790 [Geomonas sp. Red32]|uniref:hypothetical protein n=1 Tax=Geomonas sp. Red32 TaxID=2912856 RepID=UPI00202CF5D7|nr:hypothetical protein [Geomonas sp. Red32]MCM0080903.1 hypothetical protein [Geomonas sp. Red32]
MGAASIDRIEVESYRIPTERRESDGTYVWESTTLVVVQMSGGGADGIGYSYADASSAALIRGKLAEVLRGRSPYDIPACWKAMVGSLRNLGEAGIGMLAVSCLDVALWDLKAKLLEGTTSPGSKSRSSIPISRGFAS